MELFKGKPVVDVGAKEKKEPVEKEQPRQTIFYFTVTYLMKNRPMHILVKSDSALDALQYVSTNLKVPVVAVHITEYSDYIDTLPNEKITQEIDTEKLEDLT